MEMEERQAISYKDPYGFVIKKKDGFYRYITHQYKQEYDHLINSGLYEDLVHRKLMIPHKEVDVVTNSEAYYKEIYPQQILFFNYPFEWGFSQWREMLLAYIAISKKALAKGMILKDATPYNFTFHNGRCIIIDTSSFEFYREGESWKAYRQFCEEMFAPFALMYYRGSMWAKLYGNSLTGLPLSFVKRQLPFKSHFNSSTLLHIHWHSFFQGTYSKENKAVSVKGLNNQKLLALFEMFERTILKWSQPLLKESIWNSYYENDIETKAYLEDKVDIVSNWLQKVKPSVAIDVGANTGMFSFIATQYASNVIAVESDRLCVDIIYNDSKRKKINTILPIVADVVEPSPGLGWDNVEKIPLLERLKGDMLLALAVIHHICISRNVPMQFVAKLFAEITTVYAIVEFIPKTDTKVKSLLQNRVDIFDGYSEKSFIECFQQYFILVEQYTCQGSDRKLFLWQKR